MKTLFVLRHGQASPEAESKPDHARELTPRGRAEARRAAETLLERSSTPSLILTSSALRARQTAEVCLELLAGKAELAILDGLYLAEPESYLTALGAHGEPHACVMVVGHNPGLEGLVHALTDRSEHLATASLVEIALPVSGWAELSGGAWGEGHLAGTFRV